MVTITLTTVCQATVEETWTLEVTADQAAELEAAADRTAIFDGLVAAGAVVSVENADVYNEAEREVLCLS